MHGGDARMDRMSNYVLHGVHTVQPVVQPAVKCIRTFVEPCVKLLP